MEPPEDKVAEVTKMTSYDFFQTEAWLHFRMGGKKREGISEPLCLQLTFIVVCLKKVELYLVSLKPDITFLFL